MKKNVNMKKVIATLAAASMIAANTSSVFAREKNNDDFTPPGYGDFFDDDDDHRPFFPGGDDDDDDKPAYPGGNNNQEDEEVSELMAGGTVDHIDIDMEVTATVIVGGEVKDITTTIGVEDATHIDITAKQGENDVEQITEEEYNTYIYLFNGYMTELFCSADSDFDMSYGEKIIPLNTLAFELENNVLNIDIISSDNISQSLALFIQSIKEESL